MQLDPITRDKFIERCGIEPLGDDLERCNCAQAGTIGHMNCGWDKVRDMPVFIPGYGVEVERYGTGVPVGERSHKRRNAA